MSKSNIYKIRIDKQNYEVSEPAPTGRRCWRRDVGNNEAVCPDTCRDLVF